MPHAKPSTVVPIRQGYDAEERTAAAKAGKRKAITPRVRRAIDLLTTGQASSQREAAQMVGMHEESLSRALKRPQAIEAISEIAKEALSKAQSKAVATIYSLMDRAESEHVKLEASKLVLGLSGHAIGSKQGVNVTINNTPGYVLDLREPQPIDVTPDSSEVS